MKTISFAHIHTLGNIITENNQYRHVHYPEMLSRYDSNFIAFKELPTMEEFEEKEKLLREFHISKSQNHVKFYFPENVKLPDEVGAYLKDKGYDIGFLELYAIQPDHFPSVTMNTDIEIQAVTEETLEVFLELQYQSDVEHGEEFAKQKKDLLKRQFNDPHIHQVLAYYKGSPAGSVELIVTEETVEIDNLFVDETMRHQGIGSRLQTFAMELFQNKTVILVADGEDTPKDMYRKQNYEYCGFAYEAVKVYEDRLPNLAGGS